MKAIMSKVECFTWGPKVVTAEQQNLHYCINFSDTGHSSSEGQGGWWFVLAIQLEKQGEW